MQPICVGLCLQCSDRISITNFVCFLNVFHIFSPHKSNSPPPPSYISRKNPAMDCSNTHLICRLFPTGSLAMKPPSCLPAGSLERHCTLKLNYREAIYTSWFDCMEECVSKTLATQHLKHSVLLYSRSRSSISQDGEFSFAIRWDRSG